MIKNLFILIILASSLPVSAQDNYKLLEPDLWGNFATNGSITFVNFIERAYAIFLSFCIVAAFVLIIWHGLNYMVSNVPFVKTQSKGRMWTAIQGLILALTAYLLLYTINPNLVNLNLNLDQIVIENNTPGGGTDGGGTELPNDNDPINGGPGEVLTTSVPQSPNCHNNPIPAECASLRDQGVTVADWNGTNGPGRTDRARQEVVQATKWVQQKLREEKNLNTHVTAAHTNNVGHSSGSKHYQGIAVDLQPSNSSERTSANLSLIASYCRRAGFTYTKIEGSHTHCDAR